MMQSPTAYLLADALGGCVADSGRETIEHLPGFAPYLSAAKRVTQEVEADVIVITSALVTGLLFALEWLLISRTQSWRSAART